MRIRENRFYLKLGKIIWLALPVSIILVSNFSESYTENECQQFSVRGIDAKVNNDAFRQFIYNIKSNNGVLVLGTSETNAFGSLNYQGLLNKFFDCGHKFSVMAGAGRSAHVHYPMLLNNSNLVHDLNIIYFINPTYWRKSLNFFNMGYYERYNDDYQVFKIKSELEELGLYEEFASPLIKDKRSINHLSSLIHTLRNNFVSFRMNLENKYEKEVSLNSCIQSEFVEPDSTLMLNELKSLNLTMNVSKDFEKKAPENFVEIMESDFQYRALDGFNKICDTIGVNVVYILGPYNAIFCNKFSPEYCDAHEETVAEIKEYLENNNAKYIDCSDLSYLPGSFIDIQHHSKYAAWLIAERISNYYEEAE